MNTSKAQIAKKLYMLKKHPELFASMPTEELAEYLNYVRKIVESAKEVADRASGNFEKEYEVSVSLNKQLVTALEKLEKEKNQKLNSIRQPKDGRPGKDGKPGKPGKDAKVTKEQIQKAAEIAYSLIELPDFDELVTENITANPFAIRDGLELITKEKDKLSQDAIQNLREDLLQLQEQISRVNKSVIEGVGTSKNVIDYMINQRIADGTISTSGGSIGVEVPSGTINGSNTAFTVSNEPKYVVVNTLTYFEGAGYSYAGGTITFDIPPATGSFIKSIY